MKFLAGKHFKIGLTGTILSAICCFTPLLVVFLSAIGLTGLIVYLDYFLLPSLAFFFILLIYAIIKRQIRIKK